MHKTILIHEYYVMILDAYVDHTYVISLVISSHEPPFDMYSAIGVTHHPLKLGSC
ncbi:hypothetical protein HanRHA438_Chr14g0656751 [Helianthus annuus]|nr:hypothetical protein HanRHA438_Chr14g0656751 [Helianthus annuus]